MADLSGLREHLRLNARLAVDLAMQDVKEQTRAAAPRASGALADSIDYEPVEDAQEMMRTALVATDPKAGWMDDGTRPHDIVPQGPGYPLRFFWPKAGAVVRLMSVHHPGTPAYQFFREPLPDRFSAALQVAIGAFQ